MSDVVVNLSASASVTTEASVKMAQNLRTHQKKLDSLPGDISVYTDLNRPE